MQRRPKIRPLSSRFLFGAFVAVALSFMSVALYVHFLTRQIDVASDDIAQDSAPSIEHLAAVRVQITQLDHLIARYLGLFPEPIAGRTTIEGLLSTIDRELQAYGALPQFPGEQAYGEEVQNTLHDVTRAAHRIMGLVDAGAYEAARVAYVAELRPAVTAGTDAAMRDIEFNARNGREAALRIKQVRRHALWVGIGLDLLCFVVAALAGIIVLWQVRRHGALLETYTRIVEERSGELEFFAGRVAHDISNPVAAAQLGVQTALRHGAPDGRAKEVLGRADRSLKRAQAMIDGLLRFAQAGAKPQRHSTSDVRQVIDDVMRALAESEDAADIALQWEAPACSAACDAGVLTSILSNLVNNAAKYIGEAPERRIAVRATRQGPVVHVEVEDSGSGLPPDLAGRIFEPYVRGDGHDKPGLGLGLATVKRLVEGHGGRVGVLTQAGRGCTFWFDLPAIQVPAAEMGSAASGA